MKKIMRDSLTTMYSTVCIFVLCMERSRIRGAELLYKIYKQSRMPFNLISTLTYKVSMRKAEYYHCCTNYRGERHIKKMTTYLHPCKVDKSYIICQTIKEGRLNQQQHTFVDAAQCNCNPHDKDDGEQSRPLQVTRLLILKYLTPKYLNKQRLRHFLHEQKKYIILMEIFRPRKDL